MEKTIFKDRVGQYPNRRKITILEQRANEIIADVELNDIPLAGNEGTPINADVMNKFQDEIVRAGENSDTALSQSSTALTNSTNAVNTSNTALSTSRTAETNALYAKNKADEAYSALADRGATVMVNGTPVTTVSFDFDPQTQINSKVATSDLFNLIYPVGSIYMSTTGTNPGTLFGGTWEAYAQGRTIFGIGTSDKSFVQNETGGESNHTLTTSEMPSHTHTQNSHGHSGNSKSFYYWFSQFTHRDNQPETDFIGCFKNADNTNVTLSQETYYNNTDAIGTGSRWGYRKVGVNWNHTPSVNDTTATNNNTGGGTSHNNLPPYIVTYIWRRTA